MAISPWLSWGMTSRTNWRKAKASKSTRRLLSASWRSSSRISSWKLSTSWSPCSRPRGRDSRISWRLSYSTRTWTRHKWICWITRHWLTLPTDSLPPRVRWLSFQNKSLLLIHWDLIGEGSTIEREVRAILARCSPAKWAWIAFNQLKKSQLRWSTHHRSPIKSWPFPAINHCKCRKCLALQNKSLSSRLWTWTQSGTEILLKLWLPY